MKRCLLVSFRRYFFIYRTHLSRCCSVCVSPPRRTRVASPWHPRCTHRSRESAVFRSLLREKKGPPRVAERDFNPLSKGVTRRSEVEQEAEEETRQQEAVEREVGNEGCDGSATRSPPSRASSTCCWRATRPPRRPGRTCPAMNRGQLREGEKRSPLDTTPVGLAVASRTKTPCAQSPLPPSPPVDNHPVASAAHGSACFVRTYGGK